MLDLSKYQSIGAALKDALEQFSNEVSLIEADREREKERLTYRDLRTARTHLPRRCKTRASPRAIEPASS